MKLGYIICIETLEYGGIGFMEGIRGLCSRPGGPVGTEVFRGSWGQLWDIRSLQEDLQVHCGRL